MTAAPLVARYVVYAPPREERGAMWGTVQVVRARRGKGEAQDDIYVQGRIDGKRYYLRHMPLPGGGFVRIASRSQAEEISRGIQRAIEDNVPPILAIAPYLRGSAEEHHFIRHWRRFVARKQEEAEAGQVTKQRAGEVAAYERRGYLEHVGAVAVHELGFAHLEDLKAELLKRPSARGGTLAPKTVKHVINDVRACLIWLADRKEIEHAPKAPTVAVPEHLPRIPTYAQQRAMLDAIPYELAGFFLARGECGLRDAEAARANLEDYVPDEKVPTLRVKRKGKRERHAALSQRTVAWIEWRHGTRRLHEAGTPLFPNPRADLAKNPEGRWTPASRRRVMLAAMKAVGVETCPNEALRHCYGTHAIARMHELGHGREDMIRLLMTQMDHSSHKTSARYVQLYTAALGVTVE